MSASGCRNQLTLCTKPSSCAGRIPTLTSIGSWKCLAVLPVTSAEGERSFSQLRRLKTFLRATMGEERLVGVALMQCHRQLVTQLDQDQLVHKFARASAAAHDPGEHLSGIESLRLC